MTISQKQQATSTYKKGWNYDSYFRDLLKDKSDGQGEPNTLTKTTSTEPYWAFFSSSVKNT